MGIGRRTVAVLGALFLAACGGTTSPSPLFSGNWKQDTHIAGSSLSFDLAQSGASITGLGSYSIEAGRSGSLRVTGTAAGSSISLHISYDYGPQADFQGTLQDPTHITGTIQYGGDVPTSVSFTKTP
jgi:hypothetical protein